MTVIIIALTTEMVPADAMVAHGFPGMVAVQPVAAAVTAGVACTGVSATHTAAVACAVSTAIAATISAAATAAVSAATATVLRVCGTHDRQAIRE
ncbi:hypothetical protein OKW11_005278 [Pseudomonas baetica]|nr:hypothetical protein [Pseudomonas baetica]